MHFDLTDLRLFLHACDSGSITAGAERSHLALASASARLRAMETSLGTPLLVRGRRGVTPTPAGVALSHHARALIQQVNRMQEDLGEYAHGFRGQIRLLCNTAVISEFLAEPLSAFLLAHPNVDVAVQEEPSYRIVPAVVQGAADVGIVSDAVDLSELDTLPFRRDRLVLIAPDGHPLARHARARYADALDHDFVGLEAGSALALHLDDLAARAGRRMRTRVRLRTFEAVGRMVARGIGVAIVPQSAADRMRGRGGVRRVALAEEWADRRLMLCMRQMDGQPGYVRALVSALRA
ncbi:LysR family transcriptional regulator [Bordetella sp. 2513F-2]